MFYCMQGSVETALEMFRLAGDRGEDEIFAALCSLP